MNEGPASAPIEARGYHCLPLAILVLGFHLFACGEDAPVVPEDNEVDDPPVEYPLVADSISVLEFADLHVELDRAGTLRNGKVTSGECDALFISGLWIGARVGGESRANLVWVGDYPWSSFTSSIGGEFVGPYSVTVAHLGNEESVWPIEHGYPVNESGEPVVYGDAMIWSALRSDPDAGTESPILSSPLDGLEVGMSLFGFEGEQLDRALFIRWDLTNRSQAPWDDVHVGFYADTDLSFDPRQEVGGNLTGYLTGQGITYTYGGEIGRNRPQWVSGLAFLTTPTRDVPQHKVTAHRVMIKNGHPEYGEDDFSTAEQALWALEGKTKQGNPMIDPTSDADTAFAFSGDPLTGQGWIDDPPRDVRGMMSSGPFTLGPGETKTVFAVWCLAEGTSLANALGRLQGDVIRARREAYRLVVGRTG